MRLFELRSSDDRPRLTFHPRVTVIRGLAEPAVADLKSVLRSLAAGQRSGWDGTVEVHGVLVSMDSIARLVGPAAGEPVVAPIEEVLPPVPGPPRDAGDDPVAVAHARAVVTREAVEQVVADLLEQIASTAHGRDALHERLAAASARVDRQVSAALDEADRKLRAVARDFDVEPYATTPDAENRAAQLRELVDECDKVLAELPSGDRAALAAATASLRAATSREPVISPEAAALRELWLSLHSRLEGIESRLDVLPTDAEAALSRLEAARERANAARAASTARDVTSEEAARLEEMNSRMIELRARATSGMRRGSARKQMEELHTRIQEELDALGYPTFMAYRMGNGKSTVDQALYEELEVAVAELEEAEANWVDVASRLEDDEDLEDVLAAVAQVSERAAELLEMEPDEVGGDDPNQLAERLRGVLVEPADQGLDASDAVANLRSILHGCGASGHDAVIADAAVLALGESWLEVLRAADDAAVRLLRDRERAVAELEAGARDALAPASPDPLMAERATMLAAEAAVSELRRGLVSLATVRQELHELAASELATAENHDAKQELLDAARAMEEQVAARLPSNQSVATARRGITALVPRGVGGPVPMIVELGDADESSLEQLVSVSEDVQVIALGGGPGLADWVRTLGPAHAALVECASGSRDS